MVPAGSYCRMAHIDGIWAPPGQPSSFGRAGWHTAGQLAWTVHETGMFHGQLSSAGLGFTAFYSPE